MELPKNLGLPFFAYGIFKPGELGYLRIKNLVINHKQTWVKGDLRLRDGLPLADLGGYERLMGYLINFEKDSYERAYNEILDKEPKHQYRWDTVKAGDEQDEVNILAGKRPQRGSVLPDDQYFIGKDDPLFKEAFELIHETIENSHDSYKEFFKLQMSYLLLWTIIERYVTIRYDLGRRTILDKIKSLEDDDHFLTELRSNVSRKDTIYNTKDPKKKETLDPQAPEKCIKYYYQVRSNITHRGKAHHKDYRKLRESISELLHIMQSTIENAFKESESIS